MGFPKTVAKVRKIRDKLFRPLAKFLIKTNIKANHLTFISFILGLLAVYFLLENWPLFVIFGILHLFVDGLDGVVARLEGEIKLGKYLDSISDQTIAFLSLAKIYLYLPDYYLLIILALGIATYLIYLTSKMTSPVILYRTGGLIYLVLWPLFPQTAFLTAGYLLAGICIVYSLLLQLRWVLGRKEI